jgi:hypothetical protein
MPSNQLVGAEKIHYFPTPIPQNIVTIITI